MTRTVELPLWLLILILAFAAVTFASHFFFPSVRWFFRRRMERVVAQLNTRLDRPIEPFKLARRHDMIQRLIYDPEVNRAIVEHARTEAVPENVAFESARRYAREIVPRFSATAYFGFGTRAAKWFSRLFYRIELKGDLHKILEDVDPEATVIFVINHRSNMDYVLVTWLTARSSALSYAVGEWARVWPLSALIRAMGAYFIRRKSRGALYRKVLARYVHMATENGVTQAVFPEGGLSLTGEMAAPRMGLLNYVLEHHEDRPERDVIFVPVALNYDRVIEDRYLVRAAALGRRSFSVPLRALLLAGGRHLWQRLRRRFGGFGVAAVSFGKPLQLSDQYRGNAAPRTEAIAAELMDRLQSEIAVLPVPLLAWAVLETPNPEQGFARAWQLLHARNVPLSEGDSAQLFDKAVALLRSRGVIDDQLMPEPGASPLLHYYANSVRHHLDPIAHQLGPR